MFTLKKMAYIGCTVEDRKWFNSRFNRNGRNNITFGQCCLGLLQGQNSYVPRAHGKILCLMAVLLNHMDCLWEARRRRYPITELTFTVAAISGNAECLDFVLEDLHDFKGYKNTFSLVHMYPDCMSIMGKHGVPYDGKELLFTVLNKRPDCLRLLLEHGCTMVVKKMQKISGYSSVECVEVLREYGMPLSEVILDVARKQNNTELIQYLIDNGIRDRE